MSRAIGAASEELLQKLPEESVEFGEFQVSVEETESVDSHLT